MQIDLRDAYRGGVRSVALRMPRVTVQSRRLDVSIRTGVRDGQHLRPAGQGSAGINDGPAGDLYVEIDIAPTPHFRVEGRDVYLDLPVAPWQAAWGAEVDVVTPDGSVRMTVPAPRAAASGLSVSRLFTLNARHLIDPVRAAARGMTIGDTVAMTPGEPPKAQTRPRPGLLFSR